MVCNKDSKSSILIYEKVVGQHGKQTTEIFCAKINSTRHRVWIWDNNEWNLSVLTKNRLFI